MSGERHQTRLLRVLIATRPEWSHLGAALDGDATVLDRLGDLAAALAEARTTLPDVLLVDAGLQPASVPALCAAVAEAGTARVLLAAERDDALLYRAILEGGQSVVPLGAGPIEIRDAVVATARGESTIPAGVAARLLLDMEAFAARHHDPIDPPPALTPAELDVCNRVADRMTLADIAATHHLSPRLLAEHLGFAVRKLQRSYRADQALFDAEFAETHLDDLP